MQNRITGRPRGAVSKAVESAISASGVNGMTLEELRTALPGEKPASIKYAAHNLRDRLSLKVLSHRRLTVYLVPWTDMSAARKAFDERVAAEKLRRRELVREAQRRYFERHRQYDLAERRAARHGQREEQERLRAEHRAKVEQDRIARQAQKQAERDRMALLHASKRAEIALNNRLAKRIKNDGTYDHAAAVRPEPAAPTITWGPRVVRTISKAPPGRFEIQTAPALFSSMRIGEYLDEPCSCAARAA